MKLTYEQIGAICQGAVRTAKTENGVCLYRFTKEQEALYRQVSADFYQKSLATAGMKLWFETDSTSLFLKVNVTPASSRQYFSIDVMVDGAPVGYLDNFSEIDLPQVYTTIQCPLGEFSKQFPLGGGTKQVCIYLPWSMAVEIQELRLDDHAWIKPIKSAKKLLVFGDSITHGYDALRPSNRYAAKLAKALGAEEVNKGIGGERFFPALAETREPFEPDYITVAYGTNDWSGLGEEEFKEKCQAFYAALSRNYPNSRIFAITPIWRKDHKEEKKFGPFDKVSEDIENIVKEFENITCIRGFGFVPQDETYFADLRLHPNDDGFEEYFRGLYREIRECNGGLL